jgi:hypothetical protein
MFFAEETRHADEFSGEECAQVDSGFGIQESGKNHKGASLNPVLPES